MKRNLYYHVVFKRSNVVKDIILNLFTALSSYPRLLLEVFVRHNFGERYFSLAGVVIISIILFLIPLMQEYGLRLDGWSYHHIYWPRFLGHYLTWYAFLAGFIWVSLKRNDEVKRLPSVFDFKRFSLSNGDIHPRFYSLRIAGKPASLRMISIWLEPALFFSIGLVLWLIGQYVGTLLMVCSVFYSMSYSAMYHQGDHFVMDKIDEMICNEELVKSFVDGRKTSETRGFNFYGRRPADPETRRRVAETFLEDEETVAAL